MTTPGSRIRSLRIGNDVLVRGGVLQGDARRTFRLVTLNFMADGGDGSPFGAVASQARRVNLNTVATARTGGGRSGFAAPGTEQDALGEYLQARFKAPNAPFAIAETPEALDMRIQNTALRADTVLAP